jgi:XTP/dITP diphosphohydrolase
MTELVMASNNAGKIREISSMLYGFRILSLADIGFYGDIEEPYDRFEDNAAVKAETIHRFSGKNVLADDSGLCVTSLGGAPGVFSARYAGTPQNEQRNLEKLLHEMNGKQDRSAFYKAVICLVWGGRTLFFEGICQGTIAHAPQGDGGFGYDPVFIPAGHGQTFAELPLQVKNQISHRGKALEKLLHFLKTAAV